MRVEDKKTVLELQTKNIELEEHVARLRNRILCLEEEFHRSNLKVEELQEAIIDYLNKD